MTETQLNTLASDYYQTQPHREAAHPRHMVLFSGVPGSGKSYLARYLQTELSGIRVSNDELRARLHEAEGAFIEPEAEQALLGRLGALLIALAGDSPNGLLIVDSSCDRKYDFYAKQAAEHGYGMTVLRLKVPRAVIEQRLQARPQAQRQLARFDDWWHDWEAFGERQVPAVTVMPSTNPADIATLIRSRMSLTGSAV